MAPLTLMEAIARFEGFGADPTNRPTRNHNPGNITYNDFSRSCGADSLETGTPDPRYAHFPDDHTGWGCLHTLLTGTYKGMTLAATITKYAPASENDTALYIRTVAGWCQQAPDSIIDSYVGEVP